MPAIDDSAWDRLTRGVAAELARTPLPGAVLGLDSPTGRRITPVATGLAAGTLLRLSSLTKPVLAAATLTAVQDGTLALHDPVTRWLPELAQLRVLRHPQADLDDTVPAERTPTVEDLLTMRLGTGFAYEQPSSAVAVAAQDAGLGWGPPVPTGIAHTPDQWLRELARLPLMEQPGRFWRYEAAYSVLGVLLARADDRPLPQVLTDRVTGPLGMTDTAFTVPGTDAGRLVDCLVWPGDGDPAVLDPAAGSAWLQQPAFPNGAGGLVGTVDDLLTFGRAVQDATRDRPSATSWLSAPLARAMTSEQVPAPQRTGGGNAGTFLHPDGWGFGVGIRSTSGGDDARPARYGWAGGLGTWWYSFPHADVVAVAVTQCVPPPTGVLDAFSTQLDEDLRTAG